MRDATPLVSILLPVFNGADRIERAAKSVLAQNYDNIELVISDNASTDDTGECCKELARGDSRILYHRNPRNVGLLNNFVTAMRLAKGTHFKWIGDDDWLAPECISQSMNMFASDSQLILVTSQVAYIHPDGTSRTVPYNATPLRSSDPVERFEEMLRLLNDDEHKLDPLYGLFRREPVVQVKRRNMLREDQIFASELALLGPWAHVPTVLAHRNWKLESPATLAPRLNVPTWRAHFATTLQCRELFRVVARSQIDAEQKRTARLAVAKFFAHRQAKVFDRRARKLRTLAQQAFSQ